MKKILDFLSGSVIKDIGGVLDSLFTNEEERIAAKNKVFTVLKEKELELQKMHWWICGRSFSRKDCKEYRYSEKINHICQTVADLYNLLNLQHIIAWFR